MIFALLLSLVMADQPAVVPNQSIAQKLQDISVTVDVGRGSGSGVIKTKQRDGEVIAFVWTAYHVVDTLRKTKEIVDPKSGTKKTIVEYDDAAVVKQLVEDGREVGKLQFFAKMIRASQSNDLAILQVRKKNFVAVGADFYTDKELPVIGTEVLHVGSLLGQLGSNSMTKGIISQDGRIVDGKVFTQVSATAFPGSSGGGVFLNDGRLIGLLTAGAGETFNLIVPIRRMREWAQEAKVEWALDDNIPVPSEEELKKLPVDDIGTEFGYNRTSTESPKPNPNS